MTKELNKKQTLGRFDIVGEIAVDSKVFAIGSKGKNNQAWISNVFNPRVDGVNGASMFVRMQDGYDEVKGKTLYLKTVNDESMEIKFGDRFNPILVEKVNERSFVKVFTKRVEKINEESGNKFMAWEEPRKFLTVFDAINFLQTVMPLASKHKVRMTGDVRYSTYNGKLQRNFELKNFYILTNNEEEGKEIPLGFNFTQNIIVMKDAVKKDMFESEGVATIDTKLYVRKAKDQYEILDLPLIVRATEDNKDTYRKMLEKYFTVDGDTVRRVNVEGIFQVGYVSGNIDENDLPQNALELIEDGFYSKEEVLKMFLKKERVDETLLRRPIVKMSEGIPTGIDKSDEDYTMEDIQAAMKEVSTEETIKIGESSISTDSLLDELSGL